MADVLREFLVAVGFKVDAASERKFNDSITRQEKRIVEADKVATGARIKAERETMALRSSVTIGFAAMAAAVAASAVAMSSAIVRVAGNMEQLYYSSQRVKASEANLRSFAFAAGQLGSSVGEASGSLEALAKNMRASPGYESMLKGLGVATRENGKLRDTVDVVQDLGAQLAKMPGFQAKAYADVLGIDEKTLTALKSGDFTKHVAEYRDMLAKARLDPTKAAKDSADFMNVWRRMQNGLEIIGMRIEGALVKRFGASVNKFTDWLLNNSDRISSAVVRIGEVLLRLVGHVADLFTAFDRLDPATKGFIVQMAALGAAMLLLKAGPIGVILALGTAIIALYDDYRKWKEGGTDTLINWDKWGPVITSTVNGLREMGEWFDTVAKKLTGQDGLTVAFELLGAALLLKVLAPLMKVMTLLTGFGGLSLPPWLLGLLGVGAAAGIAQSNGVLGTGEGSRSTGERVLRTLDPGLADRVYGKTGGDQAADAKDTRNLWQKYAPKALGGKDAPGTGGEAAQPGAPGKYRPIYKLSDADTSQRVLDTIASEARMKDPASVDAVINNMMNRVGTKSWGPSGNLHEVSQAPGQYEGAWKGRRATEKESEYLRERIKAIASGGVPDNTGGANSFRAESYYQGEGANKTWARTSKMGPNVGGNRYATVPGVPNGPYAPYATPKPDPAPEVAKAIPKIEGALQNFNDRFNDSMGGKEKMTPPQGKPLGSWSNNSTLNTSNITASPTTNITISGAGDAKAVGNEVGKTQSRVHADLLRNLQGAVA